MLEKAIITSASNKFFPSVINLLSSIKLIYPNHPTIFVYDLGLLPIFRRELESVDNVKVVKMPEFCHHWRGCYTWKAYIFAHPLARLNFYLDAGCQVLRSLDEVFSVIEQEDVLLIDQEQLFKKIVPTSYKSIFDLDERYDGLTVVHAGIIGFKNTPRISEIFKKIYDSARAGLALGFSPNDQWRNKGKDKNIFSRDCEIFRHDMTLVNIFFRKYFNNEVKIQPLDLYHGENNRSSEQYIWQLRLSYTHLDNLKIKYLHQRTSTLFVFNRALIGLIIMIKNINLFIKKKLSII
ncbi:MAG: hypothetical protein PHD72_01060 [Patescibacteria group bacterium]|nr:hypothetical protein [Patescibacteria group bacterium]